MPRLRPESFHNTFIYRCEACDANITVELNTSRVLITALNIYMGNLLCKMQIKLVTHTCSYDHTDKLSFGAIQLWICIYENQCCL